jgi:hypothetical protein
VTPRPPPTLQPVISLDVTDYAPSDPMFVFENEIPRSDDTVSGRRPVGDTSTGDARVAPTRPPTGRVRAAPLNGHPEP